MTKANVRSEDLIYISDDLAWADQFVYGALDPLKLKYVKLPTNIPIRQSWQRLKDTKYILIHWEGRHRKGGAIIEEILDVDSYFDIASRIIVLTTEPTREDVVYFGELGVKKIVRLRNNKRYFEDAYQLLQGHVQNQNPETPLTTAWRKFNRTMDMAPSAIEEDQLEKLEKRLADLYSKEGSETARYFDAKGSILLLREQFDEAKACFTKALDINSNYYRSYTNLIKLHVRRSELDSAVALCRKMQSLNKENISRLVDMGEIFYMQGLSDRAEQYFKAAIDRDDYCSKALNGLAQIHFDRGEIAESRELLSKSNLAYVLAKNLNQEGIQLVSEERYEEALEHYSKAQYVIPMQDKGPMLFFNIGLCYSRWGKFEMAKEFLKIALIKEPNYKKARKLFDQVDAKLRGDLQQSA